METMLDLPTITGLPTDPVSTAIAAQVTKPTATLKETALASFVPIEAHMKTLAARYKDVAYDVTTPKGMNEAKAARLVLRDEGRYAVQRLVKRVKDEANDLKRVIDTRGDEVIAITKGIEDSIDGQITAEEERKAAAKAEAERIERERVAALEAKLAGLSSWSNRCKAPDMTSERIALGIEALKTLEFVEADWAEFLPRALARKAEVLEVMADMGHAALAREMEAARLEAQRIENERVAAEQRAEAERLAEQQRLLAEQAAELQRKAEALAEQERAAAQARAEKEAADREQAAFDVWADRVRPSGDVTDVHIQWEASEDYADLHGIEYQPLIAAIAAKGEADPAPAVVPEEAARIQFKFDCFNPRRAMRGAEAASLYVDDPDEADGPCLLWMSKADVGRNMMAFGRQPALVQAWEAYEAYEAHGMPSPEPADYIPPSSMVDELQPQTEAEIQAANGPEVDPNMHAYGEGGPDDAEIGRQWRENSSLEKWFPLTAERLARLEAENAALKHDLQYARDGLTKGRSRMREDNERLAREAHTWSKAAETYAAELERHKPLMQAVEWILEDGHMNQEHLARLRAAWERANDC